MGGAVVSECGGYVIQNTMIQSLCGSLSLKMSEVFVHSCYPPTSFTLPEFEDLLENLVLATRGLHP